ncbi:MAG: glutamyl-tRNA(Gln) amidotransferase subunit E [bacterium ADurb.Bin212]|nr:MAG: glutamyl-tRNA(Gln) amidotransferase subunit E [bacterium ADurb.Bin212]
MNSLSQLIDSDYISAYKNQETEKVSVLRMLKTAIKNSSIAAKTELTEEEIIKIISKEIKVRKESADQYTKGNRSDLADKELSEITILEKYLPTQLSDDEIESILRETINSSGLKDKASFGKVMGLSMPKLSGKADGQRVSQILSKLLS